MADVTDPLGGLNGEDRNAYTAIVNTLKQYGLEGLADAVMGYIKQGYSQDTIAVLLPETKEYKARFKANEARIKAGLPALSPAEYLSVESSYRQIMSVAGLPPGFYDEPADFTKWLEDDVAPTEIQARVQVASDLVNSLDPSAKAAFGEFYTQGDMVAYALDRTRAASVLERQWRAAQTAGAAQNAGMAIGQSQAERIADTGVTGAQARAGISAVAQLAQGNSRLAAIYGGTFNSDDAINEVFFDDAEAQKKRKGLASQERASFGGSSGTTTASLSQRRGGQV